MEFSSVLVLGMHRSGTSLLAGSLQKSGVYLGLVAEEGKYNRKGSRENIEIRKFNERILTGRSFSWKNPPDETLYWTQDEKEAGARLLKKHFDGENLWGMKDPRLIWTVEGWIQLLHNVHLIGVFRNPSLVADSLNQRSGSVNVSRSLGLKLWLSYNSELLRLKKKFNFPLLHFGQIEHLQKEFFNPLASFCQSLGLKPAAHNFFDESLINNKETSNDIPKECIDLYKEMLLHITTPPVDSN